MTESFSNGLLSSSPPPQGVHPWRGGGVQTVAGLTRTHCGAAFPESRDQSGQSHQGGVASYEHHNVGRYDERNEPGYAKR